jgi:fumarate reductase subunit C
VQIGETRLPGGVIIGAHYAGWAVVSALVLFLAGG